MMVHPAGDDLGDMPDPRCSIDCCLTEVVITNGGASAGGAWTAGLLDGGASGHLNKPPGSPDRRKTALSVSVHEQAGRVIDTTPARPAGAGVRTGAWWLRRGRPWRGR